MKKLLLSAAMAVCVGISSMATTFTLVTDAADLKAGDQIIIVSPDYNVAMSTTQNNNNRGAADVTISNNSIEAGSDVQIITLETSSRADMWNFKVGDGQYLYAASSSGNQLKTNTLATAKTNADASISITDNVATIIFNGNYTRNLLQYNNNNTSIFTCYASATQRSVAVYKYAAVQDTRENVTMKWSQETLDVKLGEEYTLPTLSVDPVEAIGEVVYSSSDTEVADFDENHNLIIKAAGTSNITASISDSETYKNTSVSYNLTVIDPNNLEVTYDFMNETYGLTRRPTGYVTDATLTNGDISIILGKTSGNGFRLWDNGLRVYSGAVSMTFKAETGYCITGITFTGETGIINKLSYLGTNLTGGAWIGKEESVTINGTPSSTAAIKTIVVKYEKAGDPTKEDAGLKYETTSYDVTLGDEFTAPTLVNPNNLEVSYTSSNPEVAEVDAATGAVTIKGAGTATITATSAENETYNEGKASYTINVTLPLPKFVLTNKIVSGKQYVLVAGGKVSTAQAGTKGGYASGQYGFLQTVDVTVTNDIVEVSAEYAITFTEVEGGYTMQNYLGNYICMSGTYNNFNVYETANDASVWAVEPQEDGTMKITNVAKSKYMQFDPQYNTYGSYDTATGSLPALYVLGGDDPEVPAAPALIIDGSEYTENSYSATNDSGSIEVEINVPEGHEVYYKLEETAANVATYAAEEGYTPYTGPITVSGSQTLSYYAVNTATGVKSATREIAFHIATGIEGVEVDAVNGVVEYFNLQGVKVEAPANGLYIRRQGAKVEKVIVK